MMTSETRLRVKYLPSGQFGCVEVMMGDYCTVQLDGHKYYKLVKLDDLEPITTKR